MSTSDHKPETVLANTDRIALVVCREARLKELLPTLVQWDSEPLAHLKIKNHPLDRDIQIPVERECG